MHKPYWHGGDEQFVKLLSKKEAGALGDTLSMQAWQHDPPPRKSLTRASSTLPSGPPTRALVGGENLSVRTVPGLTAGFWTDVLAATGCQAKDGLRVLGQATYRPDGRPREISVPPGGQSEACLRAARVLLSLTVAGSAKPIPVTFVDVMVLPLEPAQVACVDTPDPPREETEVPSGGTITDPKRTKMIQPGYPGEAMRSRVQGTVIIEAVISSTGCVRNAVVQSSPDASLSGAALFAVMGWRYTPALLNGIAVPFIMTVTVNFAL